MDFLKEILGEELFAQFAEKINAHNGNEANKDKQIKIANLGGGEYVSKAKHDALQALFDGKEQELTAANGLIEGFKKSAKGNEELQGQITNYQNQVTQLQEQLKQTQIDSGLKIAFMEAGGTDIDFLIWKAKNDNGGNPLELGEDGKIKGVDDIVSGLKTSAPNHFKKASGVKVEANPLPSGGERKEEPQTLADALRIQYEGK
jgi:hypothetical protein